MQLKGSVSENKYVPDNLANQDKNLTNVGDNLSSVKNKISSLKDLTSKNKILGNLKKGSVTKNSRKSELKKVFSINWGAKYTYLVKLNNFNTPLSDYLLPASSVTEVLPDIKTLDLNLQPFQGFSLPDGKGIPVITVTMYDDDTCIIERNLRAWIFDICDGNTINYLNNIVKDLYIHKLDYSRDIVYTSKYKVYPKGDIRVEMSSSDNSAREITVNFAVVGFEE